MTCHITPYSGYELRANLEGLLKKFRVTKENEKEEEIFTLANLDNGCIRKFIVKKVDESAFLASIGNKGIKEESKSLTDENENTAVLEGGEDTGDGQPLVLNDALSASTERLTENHKNDKKHEGLSNGQLKNLNSGKPARFKVGGDDSDDSMPCEEKEDKDDPGVVNPSFFTDDEDDICRGDESTASVSTRSSPDLSPSHSPRLSFKSVSDMSAPASPRHSPVSHRSGNLSHRSSVSSVRKGILKKSGSSSTINMEMVNLGLQQNAVINATANSASGMNGYHRTRFTDPYDECYVPVDTHRFVSAPDESSGMTQKSLGGHRVKFILETGKPDHVTGDYDDIRIEKMERERIERIERGKNLEVTNNSGDKGGRKCLLFCAAMLVLTASVITAGLYGSGRLGMLANIGTSGILNSGTNVGSGSGSQGKIDDFREDVYIPNALEVQFRITNRNYTDSLKSFDNQEFKNLSSTLEDKLSAVIITGEVQHNGKATVFLKIIKLEPGSILCTFRIAWKFLGDAKGDRTPPLSTKTLQQILETTFSNREEPNFKEYEIDLDSIQVYELVDKCRNKEMQCSNSCVFRDTTLRFECTCPDQKILDQDKTTCVNPNDEEKKEVKFKGTFFDVSRNDAILIQIKTEIAPNKDKEASADDSEKVENATSTAITAHSKEEVGNTTVVSENDGFNGTLINATTGDDPGQNTTVPLTETSNDTTGSMNTTKHNATMLTPDADFKVTNETTLHNETHHAPPFTINGTLVAEQPLLKVFTNSSWELPSQNFSDLRPGSSPGDARLQTMDMFRVNKSSFEVPPDY